MYFGFFVALLIEMIMDFAQELDQLLHHMDCPYKYLNETRWE